MRGVFTETEDNFLWEQKITERNYSKITAKIEDGGNLFKFPWKFLIYQISCERCHFQFIITVIRF